MTIMYGIRNCDTVKKATRWMDNEGVAYSFHDYKVSGVDEDKLREWSTFVGWEKLLNTSGTTFRKLDAADREDINEDKAIMLMKQNPSMIKRPLIEHDGGILLGYKATDYEEALL